MADEQPSKYEAEEIGRNLVIPRNLDFILYVEGVRALKNCNQKIPGSDLYVQKSF